MTDDVNGCPSEETLGAFLDARLSAAEGEAVAAHLAGCDRCIAGAEFVTRIRLEEELDAKVVPIARSRRRWPWLGVAAAVLIMLAAAVLVQQLLLRRRPGIPTLIAAAPAGYRTVEPRLTGFRWAELQHLRAEATTPDPDALRLGGAAAEVLVSANDDRSPEAVHAAGVAELLLRQSTLATEHLRDAAENGGTAAVWNDLAAAYYTAAVRDGQAAELPRALAAADRALALDDSLHEARFNRALILERLGLRNEAAAAWRAYLSRDPSSPWAVEARRHADGFPRTQPTSTRQMMERLERLAATGSPAAVEPLVSSAAQDARAWFETDVLGRWGEATVRGDTATAATLLGAATRVGSALQRASGESLLADAARAIATADAPRLQVLARGHEAYRRGRLLYRDRRLDEATAMLLTSARAFDEGSSPMAGVARFFAACTLFDRNRNDEAARLLAAIAPAAHHDALRAQVVLRLAICDQYAGRWERAVRGFAESHAAFARLHESANAAFAEASLGNTLDELGARHEAWQHRSAAFAQYETGLALIATLAAAVRSEIRADEWESARSLLALETDETTAFGDPLLIADTWRRRALVDGQLGDERSAAQDLAHCRALMARAPASSVRERLGVETDLAEAASTRHRDPVRAIALIDSAMPFLVRANDRMALPDAFLDRGRALRAIGRDAEALAAFRAGLDEIEAQRRVAPAGSAIFDTAAPLTEELVALQLAHGDAAGAFATAERTRARALLDGSAAQPATAAEVAAALPPGAMLVAYALVPDGVAAICVSRDGVASAQSRIGHRALADSVRSLQASIAGRAEASVVQTRASALERLLLHDLPAVRRATSLIVVPDRLLHSVPWAALYDAEDRTFAVERYALTVAPSAAVWLQRNGTRAHGALMLAVDGGSRSRLDPLDRAAGEGAAAAAEYADRIVLAGAEASASRFLSLAADADVVHFAGHAQAGADPALLFADGSELQADVIARARLTRPCLVVLAACSTAAGAGGGFDGPHGLARAFLAAGVPAVVATLWPVDDTEAAALFADFHRRVGSGESAAAALRHAQLTLLRGDAVRARHPAAWAGTELFGADVAIHGK